MRWIGETLTIAIPPPYFTCDSRRIPVPTIREDAETGQRDAKHFAWQHLRVCSIDWLGIEPAQ